MFGFDMGIGPLPVNGPGMLAMSIGLCFERPCTSVRCIVGTLTVYVSSSVMPDSFSTCARIASICAGQGSISVTSLPPRARCPPR